MARKERRKEEREKLKKRGRIMSMACVAAGCIVSSLLLPNDNMGTYIGICVVCGVVCGFAFDAAYAAYLKRKGL